MKCGDSDQYHPILGQNIQTYYVISQDLFGGKFHQNNLTIDSVRLPGHLFAISTDEMKLFDPCNHRQWILVTVFTDLFFAQSGIKPDLGTFELANFKKCIDPLKIFETS